MNLNKSYIIENLCARRNLFLTSRTPRNEIVSLLQTLYPQACDKELIRFGPKGDGGYLIPNDLKGIQACFSPGVSSISGFEKECAERNIEVFLADKSVESPAEEHELFHFLPKFIGVTSNENFTTLDQWVIDSVSDKDTDLLLQMDIEGCEYEVLLSATGTLMKRFRILVVEFHFLDQFWNKPFFDIARRAFDKILQTHTCVHIHPNNCCGSVEIRRLNLPRLMEFTFLRNDRATNTVDQKAFPNPLDYDNTDNESMVLPNCWYQSSDNDSGR